MYYFKNATIVAYVGLRVKGCLMWTITIYNLLILASHLCSEPG